MHTPLTPAARHALRAFAENLNRNVTLPAPSAAVAELHDAGILRQPRGSLAAHELTPLGAVVLFRLLAERANLSPSAMVALVDDAGRLLSPASDASRPRPAGMLGLRDMMHRDILRAFEPLYAKIERAGVPLARRAADAGLHRRALLAGRGLSAVGSARFRRRHHPQSLRAAGPQPTSHGGEVEWPCPRSRSTRSARFARSPSRRTSSW